MSSLKDVFNNLPVWAAALLAGTPHGQLRGGTQPAPDIEVLGHMHTDTRLFTQGEVAGESVRTACCGRGTESRRDDSLLLFLFLVFPSGWLLSLVP